MTRRVRSARLQPSPSSAYLSKIVYCKILYHLRKRRCNAGFTVGNLTVNCRGHKDEFNV